MATDSDLTTSLAPEPDAPEPSLRDDIDAAFREHATDEVDTPPAGGERARDDLGRFKAAEPADKAPGAAQEPLAPPAGTPGIKNAPATPAQGSQQTELKAPASWTPAAREKWNSVDPDVRAEIHRREGEAQRVLQESAGLRDFARSFQSIVAPYEMFIRAENSDPLRAVQALMNTAGQLRVGTPATKVEIVANIIRQHGVDLQALDTMLAGMYGVTQPGQGPQQPQVLHDPRVDQLLLMQQQQQQRERDAFQQREAWENNAIQQGLQQFASTHEFYADVAETMADLVDAASRRGAPIDLEKIYARACQLDPEVSTILTQRAGMNGNRPGGPSQAVLRARRAAASVKGDPTPTGATVPKDDSVRSAIEAAFDAHS